jgi:transcriptional regulator
MTDRSKLQDFIKTNSFGILFSQTKDGPIGTHMPFFLDEHRGTNGVLYGHMAKMNPQWKEGALDVMVIFNGPHAYISPTWYKETNTVPTWNYTAVHVYGALKIIEEKEGVQQILDLTTDFYESSMPTPWKADWDAPYLTGLMNGIVAFEIDIRKIEGKWKLNQNHSLERQRHTIEGLMTQKDPNSLQIAALMEENLRAAKKEQ